MFSAKLIAAAAASLSLMSSVMADYNPASQANVALYYGQGPNQKPLAHYCDSSSVDIIPIGFINIFPNLANGLVAENFGNQCWDGNYTGPGYNNNVNPKNDFLYRQCPQLQEDIYYCQTKTEKKILLSLGGDGGNYRLNGAADGKFLAEFLWGAYGPIDSRLGKLAKVRPLDRGYNNNNASMTVDVDGFDFDIERASTDNQVGYIATINRLRELFAEYKIQNKCSKTYLISGAPQCPLPEGNMGLTIANAHFDLLFIQFYNNGANGCTARNWITKGDSVDGFNYNKWVSTIATGASKNAKLYLGLLGSSTAGVAGDYLTAIEAQTLINAYHGKSQFGGVMLWEATYAENNFPSSFPGKNYYQIIKQLLTQYAPAITAPATVCSTTVSSSSSSTAKVSSTSKPVSISSSFTSSKITSTSSSEISSSTIKLSSSSSVVATSSSAVSSSTIEPSSSSSVPVTSPSSQTLPATQSISITSSSASPISTSIPVCNVAGFAQVTAITTFFNNDGSFNFAQCRVQCLMFGTTGTFASGGTLCACYPGSVVDTITPAPLSEYIFSDINCLGGPSISSSSSSSVQPTSSSSVLTSSSSIEPASSSSVLTISSSVEPTSSSSVLTISSSVESTSSSSVLTSSSVVSSIPSLTAQPTSSSSGTPLGTQTVSTTIFSPSSTSTPVCNVAGFGQATAITTFFNDDGFFTYVQCQAKCLSFGQTFATGKTLCACYPGSLIDTVFPVATSEILFSDINCAVGPPSSASSSLVSTSSIVSISISDSSSSASVTLTSQSSSTAAPSITSSADETFITPSFSSTFSYDSTTLTSSKSQEVTPTPSSSSQSETSTLSSRSEVVTPTQSSSSQSETSTFSSSSEVVIPTPSSSSQYEITTSSSVELTSSTSSGPVITTTPISSSASFTHFSNSSTSAGMTKISSTEVTSLPTTSSTTTYTTSTVCTTIVSTITACPPSVTNCGVGSVVTKTIPLYTTVCPVTETKTPIGKPSMSAVPTYKPTGPITKYTTSTVYTTSIYTITSCAPSVTDCPSKFGHVTTEIIIDYTTICPVTENAKPTPSTHSPAVEKPAFIGAAIPLKLVHEHEQPTTVLSSTTTRYRTIKIVKSTATIIPVQYPTAVPYPSGPVGHIVGYPVGSGTAKPTALAQVTSSAKGAEGTKTPIPVYATGSASNSRSAIGVIFAVVAGVVAFIL
ncbi:uncharacterized protein RSE6_14427 [Rhynchosporium secalis]|uniref:GH18 domain-containing protein n=1 Tax=Rhynchosporium secalis TaxID=38038 RepID=A0A1E1MVB6_RHYSE|nr:uncharacterized protein RSE6_14427 [Rhynchosporium secalis]